MDIIGFGLALLAMVLFGLYMVPRKLSGLRDFDFVLTMCLGALVTTQVARLVAHGGHPPALTPRGQWMAFCCGPVWSLGILFYTLSVTQMGLALATPIKNTTAVLGTVFGLAFFAEWQDTHPLLALVGSVLVVVCAVVLGQCGERNGTRSHVTGLGVLYAILAAVFFAAYTIPLKLAQREHVDSYSLIAWMGWGTVLGASCLFIGLSHDHRRWLREPWRDHFHAALAGSIWALSSITMTEAIRRIGLAVTWPITNLNTLVTVAVGVLVFREIDVRKYSRTILWGFLLAVAGSILLGLARQ